MSTWIIESLGDSRNRTRVKLLTESNQLLFFQLYKNIILHITTRLKYILISGYRFYVQTTLVSRKKLSLRQASGKKYSKQVHRETRRAVFAMIGPKWHTAHLTGRSWRGNKQTAIQTWRKSKVIRSRSPTTVCIDASTRTSKRVYAREPV